MYNSRTYVPPTEKEDSRISTLVVRGSTQNIMDNLERALDDGVNTFKALTKDARFVPGAGATEIELAKQLTSYGEVSYALICRVEYCVIFVCADLSWFGAVRYQEIC